MSHLEMISPSVVAITSGWSHGNVGAIALDNFSIVIDTTNSPERGAIFREELNSHYDVPAQYTFLTHHHSDHASGLNAFNDTTIISYKHTAKRIRSLTRINTYPSVVFDKEYTISDNDEYVELHHTGGHTSDSSFLYFPKERVIFAGDLIFEGYLFFAGYQSDPNKWIEALKLFKELRPSVIVPGHGPPLKSAKSLNKHISLLTVFRNHLQDAARDKKDPKSMKTPEFVYKVSTRAPKNELEKWFRRTAISWFRRV